MADLSKISAEELLERAEAELAAIPPNLENAEKFLTAAYKKNNQNINIVNALAQFVFENGQTDDPTLAANLLRQSIELQEEGFSWRYLYLGQLASGTEALKFFDEGLKVAENDPNKKSGELVSFYTAIVELFMTDLCDEENAQKICEDSLEDAHKLEPENFEVNATLALYNKTIGCMDKGQEFGIKAFEILEAKKKELDDFAEAGGDLDDAKMEKMTELENAIPMIEVQLSLVRSLIDLQLIENAEVILNDCLEQDDEDVQIWFLLGLSACTRNDKEEAESCLERAVFCCNKHNLQQVWEEGLESLQARIGKMVEGGESTNKKCENSGIENENKLDTSECSTAGADEMKD